MSNNGHIDEEEQRKVRYMKSCFQAIKRPEANSRILAKMIVKLAERDIKAMAPDNYEEIIRLMDLYNGVSDYLLGWLRYILKTARGYGEDMPKLQEHIYDTEDHRESLINLRLTIMSWFRWFEDIPTETERLEMLMSKPTAEEDQAAHKLAIETGGASLLRQDPQGGPGEASDG